MTARAEGQVWRLQTVMTTPSPTRMGFVPIYSCWVLYAAKTNNCCFKWRRWKPPKGRPFIIVDCPLRYEKWGPRAKYQRRKQDKERANRCSAKRREKEEKAIQGMSWQKLGEGEGESQPGIPGSGNGWGMSNVQLWVVICAVTPLSSPHKPSLKHSLGSAVLWEGGQTGQSVTWGDVYRLEAAYTEGNIDTKLRKGEVWASTNKRCMRPRESPEMSEGPWISHFTEAGGSSQVVQYYRKGEPCDS